MRIDILTLFPKMFDGFKTESIIKRAIEKEKVEINIIDIRDYTPYKNNQVDDYQFGGGGGMVMMCEPVFNAVEAIRKDDSHVIILSPRGKTFNQKKAYEFTEKKHLIIICGHYEGFDERIYSLANEVVSIGNFVLTGGELPAMMISDAVIRLLDGVISDISLESESFNDNMLDYPVYTKPPVYDGHAVPEVLMNGNHKLINEWRRNAQIEKTKERRPDLLD
jgi:tRNA (guanine37-N1)-methyltransferase